MRDDGFDAVVAPHRMQPVLSRITAEEARLTPLDPASRLYREKAAVRAAGQSRWAIAGFDPANAIKTIARYAHFTRGSGHFDHPDEVETAFAEDFALLDAATGTVPWMCVCVPSRWAPEDKVGRSFADIHAPVADGQALRAAAAALVRTVCDGRHWQREVWTLTPDPHYDQHPRRHPAIAWPSGDDDTIAACAWLRHERQTFLPVHDADDQPAGQAVFAIRITMTPLRDAVRAAPDRPARLAQALASMSDAVLAYKHLGAVRDPLLRWLQRPTGAPHGHG